MKREPVYKKLPVPLTDEELSSKRDELAHNVSAVAKLEAEKSDTNKKFGDRIKELRGSSNLLAKQIESRSMDKDVPCDVYYDLPTARAVLIRRDTAKVAEVRKLSPNEIKLLREQGVDEMDKDMFYMMQEFENQMLNQEEQEDASES